MIKVLKKKRYIFITKVLTSLILISFLIFQPVIQKTLIQTSFNIYFWSDYRLKISSLNNNVIGPFSMDGVTFLLKQNNKKIFIKEVKLNWKIIDFLKNESIESLDIKGINLEGAKDIVLDGKINYKKGFIDAKFYNINEKKDYIYADINPKNDFNVELKLIDGKIYSLPSIVKNFSFTALGNIGEDYLVIKNSNLKSEDGDISIKGKYNLKKQKKIPFNLYANGSVLGNLINIDLEGTHDDDHLNIKSNNIRFNRMKLEAEAKAYLGKQIKVDYKIKLKKPRIKFSGVYVLTGADHSVSGFISNKREYINYYTKVKINEKSNIDFNLSVNQKNINSIHAEGFIDTKNIKNSNVLLNSSIDDMSFIGSIFKINDLYGNIILNLKYNKSKIDIVGSSDNVSFKENSINNIKIDIGGIFPNLFGEVLFEDINIENFKINEVKGIVTKNNDGSDIIINSTLNPINGRPISISSLVKLYEKKISIKDFLLKSKEFELKQSGFIDINFYKKLYIKTKFILGNGYIDISSEGKKSNLLINKIQISKFRDFFKKFKFKGLLNANAELNGENFSVNANVNKLQKFDKIERSSYITIKNNKERPTLELGASLVKKNDNIKWDLNLFHNSNKFKISTVGSHQIKSKKINGTLIGNGDMHFLKALVPFFYGINGDINLNTKISGNLNNPYINGVLNLNKGKVIIPEINLIIKNIKSNIQFLGKKINIISISGNDINNKNPGTVLINGTVQIPEGGEIKPILDLKGKVNKFLCLNTEFLLCKASADLTYKGSFEDASLSGNVFNERLDIDLGATGASIADIPFKDIYLDTKVAIDLRKRIRKQKDNKNSTLLNPNIKILLNDSVYVRGLGLESNWGGNLIVTKSVVMPSIIGEVLLKKGNLKILESTLTLASGKVTFETEDDITPILFIEAERKVDEYNTKLTVHGPSDRPKISFFSNPSLSNEEIVAYMFFGKSLGQMTPSQSIQIATMIATSSQGNSSGLMSTLKNGFGLDTLELKTEENPNTKERDPLEGHKLEFGKKLNDKIYVSVNKGIGNSETKASIEFKITDKITADIDMGAQKQSGVGLSWSKRY